MILSALRRMLRRVLHVGPAYDPAHDPTIQRLRTTRAHAQRQTRESRHAIRAMRGPFDDVFLPTNQGPKQEPPR